MWQFRRGQILAHGARSNVIDLSDRTDIKTLVGDNRWIYSTTRPFPNYTAGQYIRISGGTNWLPGYYAVSNYQASYNTGADGNQSIIFLATSPVSVLNQTGGQGGQLMARPPVQYMPTVFDGNSLIEGSLANQMVAKVLALRNITNGGNYSFVWDVRNVAVNSSTTVQRTTAAPTTLDPLYNATTCFRLVFSEVINDLALGGATAAQAIAHLQTYCAARKAVGWTIYMMEPSPRSDTGTPGTYDADRLTVRAWMRDPARIGVDFDFLIPLPAGMDTAGDELGVNYVADKAHWSATGAPKVATIVDAALPYP